MRTGEIWQAQIKEALDSVEVAVFLVSSHFQASDFIVEHEVEPLLAAIMKDKAKIFPVMVRPALLTPELAQLQFANDTNRPLSGMNPTRRDEFWVQLVEKIEDALN